jgi:PAS domain S-box-containing protein
VRPSASLPPLLRFAPVAVASLGLDGRILDANQALLSASGYSKDELLGQSFSRFMRPGSDEEVRGHFAALAEGSIDSYRVERKFLTKSGDVRDVDLSVSLVRDEATHPDICLAVLQDVTAHKRALEDAARSEDALKLSEARYRAIMEQSPFSIQVLSPEGFTLRVNSAWERLWGVKFEQIAGTYNILEDQQLVRHGIMPEIHRGFAGQASELPPIPYDPKETIPEISIEPEGPRWVRAVIYPIKDERGRVREVVLIHEDVSHRVRAEEERKRVTEEREQLLRATQRAHQEAEAASRIKDEFLATLSHELRTPLNAVIGWVRILRGADVDARLAHGLDVIDRNAWAQARMIDDLLDLSRIATGNIRLLIEPVDVGALAVSALDSLKPAADAKGIRLVSRITPGLPPLPADPQRLQQVIWNLLANAVKFTDAGGRVELSVERDPRAIVIAVSDTGAGISAATLPYIFEPFTQGELSSSRARAGLGLGLAIVRRVVELHGGDVTAFSEGPERGSTFRVSLPLQ